VQRVEKFFPESQPPSLTAFMTDDELTRLDEAWRGGWTEAERVWTSMSEELLRRLSVAS
jgi:hypothetical protein